MKYLIKKFKYKTLFCLIVILLRCCTRVYAGIKLTAFYDFIVNPNFASILINILILLISWGLTETLALVSEFLKAKLKAQMNNTLREQISKKIIANAYQNDENQGAYSSWFIQDIQQIDEKGIDSFFVIFENGFLLLITSITLLLMHRSIFLLSFLGVILLSLIPRLSQTKIKNLTHEVSSANEIFSQRLNNRLRGLGHFKLNQASDIFIEKNQNDSQQLEKQIQHHTQATSLIIFGIEITYRFINMFIMLFTALLAHNGKIYPGIIFAVGNLTGVLFDSADKFMTSSLNFATSKVLFDKFKVEQKKPTLKRLEPFSESILCSNLSIQFHKDPILKNRNFVFDKGKKYAITGASGSGKTSLIKTIIGLSDHYTGVITWDGIDIKAIDKDYLWQQITYVRQNDSLFNDTLRFNLTLGKIIADEMILEELKKVNLMEFYENTEAGLDTEINDLGTNLSGGQIQRILIARARLRNKLIYFIDEGTSALDQENTKMIENLLLSEKLFTVIYISHKINADNIHLFDEIITL